MRTWWDNNLMSAEEIRLYVMARRFGGTEIRSVSKNHSRVAKKWIRRYWKCRYKFSAMRFDYDVVINGISYKNFDKYSLQTKIDDYNMNATELFHKCIYSYNLIGKIGIHYIFSEKITVINENKNE